MISFTLKKILELVPEAMPMVKEASLEDEYPIDSKSSCFASALRVAYQTKVQGSVPDYSEMMKVAHAVEAYGIEEDVDKMVSLMLRSNLVKSASAGSESEMMVKKASFEDGCRGISKDVVALNSQAKEVWGLCKQAGVEPEWEVTMYSGKGFLNKQACLSALSARFEATGDDSFVKLAAAMSVMPEFAEPSNTTSNLLGLISKLDKKAGLDSRGFDIYKEASVQAPIKSVLRVRIGNQEFPYEKIARIPTHHLSNYLGADIAKEISSSDPMTGKAVVESLPADMQQVLLQVMKSC